MMEGEEGDSVYIILEGFVKVFKTESDGREKILKFLSAGDLFGEMALIDGHFRSASVQAVKRTTMYVIERNKFNGLINKYPQIALKIIFVLSERLREANDEITNLAFKSVEERLFFELKKLGETFGIKKDDGVWISEKITHQELAELIGTTRETITKYLGKMLEEGTIKMKEKHIFLPRYKFDGE
jgi:CRP/FNR family transcriptional regulator